MDETNPLIDDAFVDFLLYEVLDVEALTALPGFEHHSRETFELFLDSVRRFARRELWPSYRSMDEQPPVFEGGRITTHPSLPKLWKQMVELGVLDATRSVDADGVGLPLSVYTLASAYLMAGNPSVYGFAGLTIGAANLIEAFATDEVKAMFLPAMNEGRWTGTMALTEPQAGSSLADITTTAKATDSGHHLVSGAKIFISGGDHRATENVVHLALARIEGAPEGSRGISLFAIPNRRLADGELVDNDVAVAGMIHKIGWKGLPSLALQFGERDDCRGYLVGEAHSGLRHMFQMMNEARIMVGVNGAATASVGYHESRNYAHTRLQGRTEGRRGDPVAIIGHPDVRRMLLRQKAITHGSLALLAAASRYCDIAEHSPDEAEAERAGLLLDLLTPIAKTFPAERGFESNALAVQIHGGYGYSSEYVVESLLRDQKLNSLHEGTSGIQSLDLLGRKALGSGGRAVAALSEEIGATCKKALQRGLPREWSGDVGEAMRTVLKVTRGLAERGKVGDVRSMLAHSFDYLEMLSTVVIAWQWLEVAAVAKGSQSAGVLSGVLAATQYWIATEVPRVEVWAKLIDDCETSYLDAEPSCF